MQFAYLRNVRLNNIINFSNGEKFAFDLIWRVSALARLAAAIREPQSGLLAINAYAAHASHNLQQSPGAV